MVKKLLELVQELVGRENMTNKNNNSDSKKTLSIFPFISAILSLFLPGLGQLISKAFKKGLVILFSTASLIGLFIWRINLLTPYNHGVFSKLSRAIERKPTFMILTILFLLILWVLNVLDAYKTSKEKNKSLSILGAILLILFFIIGWQISEINIYKAVSEFGDAVKPLSKVLWPWEAAIKHPLIEIKAQDKVLIGNEGKLPEKPKYEKGKPYIEITPRKGNLSKLGDDGNTIPGTLVTLKGKNFIPNKLVKIWWKDSLSNEFQPRENGKYLQVMADKDGNFQIQFHMPYRLIPPSAKGPQYHTVEARQIAGKGTPIPSEPLIISISKMIETIFMGMMATFFGIIFAIPVSFLAARNIMSGSKLTLAIYYLTRTILNIIRSIEPLIWAIIAVVWVGLGPFAGIIALTFHSIAALGKLYSEAIEGIDHGPIEAIQATGANKLQVIFYGVIPQMISPFVSFSIYRWDINVRMSTVIGLVGGGGIGFILIQYIRLLDYKSAGIAVWFIAVTVSILDYVSAEIRRRVI